MYCDPPPIFSQVLHPPHPPPPPPPPISKLLRGPCRYMNFWRPNRRELTSHFWVLSEYCLYPPLWLNDASLEASAVKNGSKKNHLVNEVLTQNLAFASSLLNKSRKQLVMSRKSLSYRSIELADIVLKDCFAAWESLAAFLSFDLLLKSYKKFD